MFWNKPKKELKSHLIIEPYGNDECIVTTLDDRYKSFDFNYLAEKTCIKGFFIGENVTYEIIKPQK